MIYGGGYVPGRRLRFLTAPDAIAGRRAAVVCALRVQIAAAASGDLAVLFREKTMKNKTLLLVCSCATGASLWWNGLSTGLHGQEVNFGTETLPSRSISAQPRSRIDERTGNLILTRGRIDIYDERPVASPRPGILAMVEPEVEGAHVEAGQMIVKIRDEVAQASLNVARKRAENNVEEQYARATKDVSETQLKRATLAIRQAPNSFSDLEMDALELDLIRSTLQIEKALIDQQIGRLEVEQAEAELTTYSVKAEVSGEGTHVERRASP